MVYARPDARPLLISNGDTIDLVSGERVPQGLVTSSPFGVARNQRAIWTRDIFDFRSTYAYDLRYSAISSSPVQIRLRATARASSAAATSACGFRTRPCPEPMACLPGLGDAAGSTC